MIKSSVFFASILSIILAQTYATEPSQQETSSTWGHDSRDVGDLGAEKNPSIGCILFGDAICYLYCRLSIDAYYYEINTQGHCDDNQDCVCYYEVDAYLPHNWAMKFDADYVYWAIVRNQSLFDHVYNLFTKPFKTAEELKKILHPYLSPYQYSKLLIRDSAIAHMLIENGNIQDHLVQEYVSYTLQEIFDSAQKYKFYTNYEQNFRNALKNVRDQGTLYNIAFEIRILKNEKLERILREHVTTNKLQQPDIVFDDSKSLEGAIYHAITREIIKQRDRMDVDPRIGEAVHSALNTNKKKAQKQPSFHY